MPTDKINDVRVVSDVIMNGNCECWVGGKNIFLKTGSEYVCKKADLKKKVMSNTELYN